ncbi:MAG: response regulator transcription factor [Chloroflexi bacterium]|nr:response regulator transcription factor [Chloroflexota bacterium]
MSSYTLLVVANDPLARAGLAMMLATNPDYDIIGQLSGDDLMTDATDNDADTEMADAIVWDLGWDFEGTTPDWQELEMPIVALVPEGVETAVLWSSGVQAILPRNANSHQILAAIHAATAGLITFDPATTTLPRIPTIESKYQPVDDLTPREKEVIQLLAEGMTNKAIAQQLSISNHTVKFHVNAILTKLNAQSRTQAVVRATRLGLISL